jgi:hypothetical protein
LSVLQAFNELFETVNAANLFQHLVTSATEFAFEFADFIFAGCDAVTNLAFEAAEFAFETFDFAFEATNFATDFTAESAEFLAKGAFFAGENFAEIFGLEIFEVADFVAKGINLVGHLFDFVLDFAHTILDLSGKTAHAEIGLDLFLLLELSGEGARDEEKEKESKNFSHRGKASQKEATPTGPKKKLSKAKLWRKETCVAKEQEPRALVRSQTQQSFFFGGRKWAVVNNFFHGIRVARLNGHH